MNLRFLLPCAALFLLLNACDSEEDSNAAPEITSSPTAGAAENQTTALTVTASDSDSPSLTFSLSGGADLTLFAIDADTGELTFLTAPDYESPGDADADNEYAVTVTVSDGRTAVSQDVTVSVTDVNEAAPSFTSATAASVAENQTGAMTVTADDADGSAVLTYSLIGGADQALFSIGSDSGDLVFLSAPDFESASDANTDNDYELTVQVTDGDNDVTQNITITVTDANDAPTITSSGSMSIVEALTSVGTVTADDEDAGATWTFSLAGGADQALFDIDSATGALSFLAAPDYEVPGDADADNAYELIVEAHDGAAGTTQDLTVAVTDVPEDWYPVNFHSVAATTMELGDHYGVGGEPLRTVVFNYTFYFSRHEITNQQFVDMLNWALAYGFVEVDNLAPALASEVRLVATDPRDGTTAWDQQRLCRLWTVTTSQIEWDGTAFGILDCPSHPDGDVDSRATHPVSSVTWYGAAFYCWATDTLSGVTPSVDLTAAGGWSITQTGPGTRLPLEDEWEYAAKGGWDSAKYPWWRNGLTSSQTEPDGSEPDQDNGPVNPPGCPYEAYGDPQTMPVGQYYGNALGLEDMGGNVSELTGTQMTATSYYIRGGNYGGLSAMSMRCAEFGGAIANDTSPAVGFRVARQP